MQKVVRFDASGTLATVLSLASIAKPTPPPGYALVQIHASAINISDVMNVEGRFPFTTTPRTPGRDFAGVVSSGPSAGRRVWGTGGTHGFDRDGSHAQWIVVPEDTLQYMEMPGNLSFPQAAAVGVPYLTAWSMLGKAELKQGQYALVLGSSGGIGAAAVQIARQQGAIPIETSRRGSEPNAVNIMEDIPAQVLQKTGGKGLSAVLDSVGDAVLFKKSLETLAPSGRYVFVSVAQTPGAQFTFDALDFYRNNRTLAGVNTLKYSFEESVRILSELRAGFEEGALIPPSALEMVDMGDEKAVIEAYGRVKTGTKMKQILVNNEA
ncbi:hypothetical protein B0H10DRAFT_2061294 [Mycena sp. CBHHK59/15]|nr:hypothetical protein B0H10DRAFT_2061294 [Mycena sp. CBHHK59/15]